MAASNPRERIGYQLFDSLFGSKGILSTETLAANVTLDETYPGITLFDPGGSARDVTLEAEETSPGKIRLICNTADAAEALSVKNDAGTEIDSVPQNGAGLFICNEGGTAWASAGIFTYTAP